VRGVYGMASGLVKWDDRSRNSRGEDGILDHGFVFKGEEADRKLTLNNESIGIKGD
jgi:hypothetical protein